MKVNFIILLALLALGGLWTFANTQTNFTTKPTYQKLDNAAPNFSYKTLEGKKGSLSDHHDKVVFVHFWASWCAPCLVEFPQLIKLAENHPDKLTILAITLDTKKSDATRFLKRLGSLPDNVLIIQDAQKDIAEKLYGTIKLPETFILAPNLSVYEKTTGPEANWNSNDWNTKIIRIFGE